MTTPLSLFLTSFSALPSARIMAEPIVAEPRLTLTHADLDARLQAAAAAARRDAEQQSEAKFAALDEAHQAAISAAIADARAQWVAVEGERLAQTIETAMTELRARLEEQFAAILRPLLADAVLERTQRELAEALDRLLADPDHPALTVHGPADLLAALRETCAAPSIEWIAADAVEVTVVAGATRIATRQAPALQALEAAEA